MDKIKIDDCENMGTIGENEHKLGELGLNAAQARAFIEHSYDNHERWEHQGSDPTLFFDDVKNEHFVVDEEDGFHLAKDGTLELVEVDRSW